MPLKSKKHFDKFSLYLSNFGRVGRWSLKIIFSQIYIFFSISKRLKREKLKKFQIFLFLDCWVHFLGWDLIINYLYKWVFLRQVFKITAPYLSMHTPLGPEYDYHKICLIDSRTVTTLTVYWATEHAG
jgi:hypothetical protein